MNFPGSFFYGWWVVTGVFAMLAVGSGFGFYNLSVLLAALTEDGRFSVAAASGAPGLFFLSSGLVGIGVALLIERFDIRLSIVLGAVVCSLAMVLIGRVAELWQLYAVFILFGAGFSASALMPATTLVTRWFARRRSIAMALATSGLSVGGVCLTPLSAWLIAELGLQQATLMLALFYVIGIIPIALWLLKPHPSALGLGPDGGAAGVVAAAADGNILALKEIVRSRYFIGVTLAFAFALLSQVGAIAHLFKLVSERADVTLAAYSISLMAGCSLCARLFGGWLAGRISQYVLALTMICGQGSSLLLMAYADTWLTVVLSVVLFGVCIGNILMLLPLLLAEAYGVRQFGRVYSISQLVVTFGVASGPVLLGVMHDLAGGYQAAYSLAGIISLLAGAVLWATGKKTAPRARHFSGS